MKIWIKSGGLVLVLLMSMQWAFAARPPVLEASFQRIFDGNDFFDPGKHLEIKLSTMSDLGNLVAFYGAGAADGYKPHLFIHNFDSTGKPVEVSLPAEVGTFRTNTGLTSNAVGSRIFFVADDALDTTYGDFLFCMLDTTTKNVTVLLDARPSNIELPQDIATDANGSYLYFNETDNGDRGDLWRIQVVANAEPKLVIDAGSVEHPSGGFGRFIDEFDVSDDGKTIAFFIEGVSGSTERYDKELFVKVGSGEPWNLTDDDNEGHSSAKNYLRLSGDGKTMVYRDINKEWTVTKVSSPVNTQKHIEPGYIFDGGNRPGISTDGSVIFGTSNPITVSNLHGYLINSDGSGRLQMDTRYASGGFTVQGTAEGIHLSGGGNRVFFKARPYVESIGTYVTSLYTGIFNQSPWLWNPNPPWPTEVPTVFHVDYPAPLAFGITNPDDFPPFKVEISVSDPQDVDGVDMGVDQVALQLLRYNGYSDNGGYGPIKVSGPSGISRNLWESQGQREQNWPTPVAPKDYDPLEQEIARFSVKDIDGNVAYRDVILQAAEGGCSGTGDQALLPEDMGVGKDVSCITDGLIETVGEVIVKDGVILYLSGYRVYLNGGLNNFFKVQAGAGLIVR